MFDAPYTEWGQSVFSESYAQINQQRAQPEASSPFNMENEFKEHYELNWKIASSRYLNEKSAFRHA
jgi:hypothetical protein